MVVSSLGQIFRDRDALTAADSLTRGILMPTKLRFPIPNESVSELDQLSSSMMDDVDGH